MEHKITAPDKGDAERQLQKLIGDNARNFEIGQMGNDGKGRKTYTFVPKAEGKQEGRKG